MKIIIHFKFILNNHYAWKHDGLGNWMEYDKNGEVKTQTVSAMNEYMSFGGQGQSFNAAGNLTNDGQFKRKYNYRNMLVAVNKEADTPVAKYTYDAQNRRVTKNVNNATTKFIWDGWEEIEEHSNGQIQASYVHAPKIDEHLLMERNGQRYYYNGDMLNSVYAVTDAGGQIAQQNGYTAFGAATGGGAPMFTGRPLDAETGEYYFRYRMYNQAQGNFTARDLITANFLQQDTASFNNQPLMQILGEKPVEDDFDYKFANNSPLNYNDPLGLKPEVYIWESEAGKGVFGHVSTVFYLPGSEPVEEWELHPGWNTPIKKPFHPCDKDRHAEYFTLKISFLQELYLQQIYTELAPKYDLVNVNCSTPIKAFFLRNMASMTFHEYIMWTRVDSPGRLLDRLFLSVPTYAEYNGTFVGYESISCHICKN